MGSQRTKEDDVMKISMSVFVTNFPKQTSAKDLWNACKQYGHVVDAFVPNKRSKAGKRFGFVRFIKVFDVEHLVGNLCKVKEFGVLENLKVALGNDGFTDIDLRYLVGNDEMDNQRDNCDVDIGKVRNISDEVNFSPGYNTFKKAGGESMDSDHCRESEGYRKGGSILIVMDELIKFSEKKLLWDYLGHVIDNWKDTVIIMGDFNQCHRSALKMSKLDRFLMSESLLTEYPNFLAITLDRFLSNHRPILLRESTHDYGPIPFRFFHYWFEMEGFDNFVNDVWREAPVDTSNAMINVMNKLKYLKKKIRVWNDYRQRRCVVDTLHKHAEVVKLIQKVDKLCAMEASQKGKIKWAIEGDENSKYYHGILNKKRNQLSIRGVLVEGDWVENPNVVKNEFLNHFKNRFDLEAEVSNKEIKKAVWDCGVDKSSGPDGFTFGFYKSVDSEDSRSKTDIVNEVQSAFVADRQILNGPFILNEVFQWCKLKKKHSFILKIDFEKAYDYVRWDYLDDVLRKFGLGEKWCIYKGLKQGDPLSPFLFILVMESLHISFKRVMDAGMFNGIVLNSSMQLSHMFYAVFMGQWSTKNIDTIIYVLKCFHRASGLIINLSKSKLLGVVVSEDRVVQAANKMVTRLSKWKMKTLSIGGRLTLLKAVLGSMPIYHMSIFKVPMKVLHHMESIRGRFFSGVNSNSKKSIWVKWSNVLCSKEKGDLGVSSLYALNRALMCKWFGGLQLKRTCYGLGLLKLFMVKMGRMVADSRLVTSPFGEAFSRR
ncbi:RNA-directed DNA polymerase, eukaryota, reverse transcriptase zinc-binding domain protein [Tanacetum coccineum]